MHNSLRALSIAVSLVICANLSAETYPITVKPGARQTFQGFGSSQVSMEFGHFAPEPYRSEMADLIYRDLRANVLRLWVQSGPEHSVAAMKAAFYADYVDNGVIDLITQRGVTTLLLAPTAPRDGERWP